MVGGRDYGESQFNRATDALRQPGSSFKPFVYTTAMMNGFTPTDRRPDAPICIGNWCPQNYSGGYSGAVTLTTALVKSINTVAGAPRAGGRPRQDRRRRAPHGHHQRAPHHPLAAARPSEVTRHRHGRRLRARSPMAATRRRPTPSPQIINSQGEVVYDRKRDAPPTGARARRQDRGRDERHAGPGAGAGHRPPGQARRHQDRRQDRHDLGLPRRLVRRLHRQLRGRRLVRQRRLRSRPGGSPAASFRR